MDGILRTAGLTKDRGTEELIAGVADYIRTRGIYDINAEPYTGSDYAVDFLTSPQRGYCIHYATAAAVLFRSLDIPVRTLECCSGDLADLKVKSCDVEAWSPRQKKYFAVGSCSNLGDAQARRLQIRVKGEDGSKYFAHTLNNTVVAPPRMLIAFLENNLNGDGTVSIPEPLRMYMGGKDKLIPTK